MTVEVRYVSRAGSTKKVADAIAAQLQTVAKEVHTPLAASTDILFLGSGIYAGGADKALQTFISNLTPSMVKKVVVFTTGASQDVYPKIKA